MEDINMLEANYFKALFNKDGTYILDDYEIMTFEELRGVLMNAYLYTNPWHNTNQAEYYTPYLSFKESITLWANDKFYRQHKASKHYLSVLDWLDSEG